MASEVSNKFRSEKTAIEELRRAFPTEQQMTLAKRIRVNNFSDPAHQVLATTAGLRSRLSIYSVIRRYDADRKALIADAVSAAELDAAIDAYHGSEVGTVTA